MFALYALSIHRFMEPVLPSESLNSLNVLQMLRYQHWSVFEGRIRVYVFRQYITLIGPSSYSLILGWNTCNNPLLQFHSLLLD